MTVEKDQVTGIGRNLASGSPDRLTRSTFFWLLALTIVFCFRVVAQLLQLVYDLPFLPSFDSWHGGVLPYGALLASQVLIAGAMLVLAWRVKTGALRSTRARSVFCLIFGGVYLGFMLFRLGSGLTFWSEHPWFSAWLPTVFHLVLATYVLVLGVYHFNRTRVGYSEDEPRRRLSRASGG